MDLYSGNMYCLFFPYSPEHLVHSVYKSRGMRSDISFSVNAISREPNNASGSASALFIGGFSIQGMGQVLNSITSLVPWQVAAKCSKLGMIAYSKDKYIILLFRIKCI